MLFYEQQYLLDIHIIPMISWQLHLWLFFKSAFLTFLPFPTPKIGLKLFDRKKIVSQFQEREKCSVSRLICEKMTICSSDKLRWRKKAPFFEACTVVTFEIIHIEEVQCNTKEWP